MASVTTWPKTFTVKVYLIYLSIFVATSEDLGELPVWQAHQQSKPSCFDHEVSVTTTTFLWLGS